RVRGRASPARGARVLADRPVPVPVRPNARRRAVRRRPPEAPLGDRGPGRPAASPARLALRALRAATPGKRRPLRGHRQLGRKRAGRRQRGRTGAEPAAREPEPLVRPGAGTRARGAAAGQRRRVLALLLARPLRLTREPPIVASVRPVVPTPERRAASASNARDWTNVLADVPLFAGLGRRHRNKVAGLSRIRRFHEGATIVVAGQPGDTLY